VKYIIIFLLAAILTASAAQADVCIEQPPGEIICVPESPVGPEAMERVWLPVVGR
jgi:hypothetical protein